VSGWFINLCYGFHRDTSCHIDDIRLNSLAVPVKVDNENTNESKMCHVIGGFHGVESLDGCHKPLMSLVIMDDTSTITPYQV
jgi:hypothetical protein